MNKQTEIKPAAVPERATQDGEIRARWAWVEPSVWTDRMLAALENGVKGNVWFSLIDKVYSLRNLQSAYAKVKANGGAAGVDHQTIERYEERKEANLEKLSEQLRDGTYQPQVYMPKVYNQNRIRFLKTLQLEAYLIFPFLFSSFL